MTDTNQQNIQLDCNQGQFSYNSFYYGLSESNVQYLYPECYNLERGSIFPDYNIQEQPQSLLQCDGKESCTLSKNDILNLFQPQGQKALQQYLFVIHGYCEQLS
ncbi:hypothetical protein PPERSA_07380 [Pseudocohnilembus persalinus]|uniref:Uncharacterized protein n=1 Tax=Pseudocohnilembus persalinus TaxID=266149 RepID=A0A0V0Q9J9_PSEPJ|nr:hypothetical protein PPERSA_07380 [Pseudocohnilembus persalinus]|eukprot:KRW98882.1 hypothetical protein PPERSA_07380 [Pseudocohnilembus persalinus]